MIRGFFILGLFLLGACQTPGPTKVFEAKENREKGTNQVIKSQLILVDARPPFLSMMAKPSGALSLQWEDFNQKKSPFEGELEKDLFFHARRLARMGVGPDSEILVLGRGKAGDGEEGRVAWTLRRLGLKKVKFASMETISWSQTTAASPEVTEVPVWKPELDETLEISRVDAIENIRKDPRIWILDVNPTTDYLKEGDLFAKMKVVPKIINVPWTEFLNAKGELEPSVKQKLKEVGLDPSQTVYVMDELGVRSAGTTLLLRDLGYSKAAHWSGGVRELRWFAREER